MTLAALKGEYTNEALCQDQDDDVKSGKKKAKVGKCRRQGKMVLLWATTWMPEKWISKIRGVEDDEYESNA